MLSSEQVQYDNWWAGIAPAPGALPVVDSVQVAEMKRFDRDVLTKRFSKFEGKPLNIGSCARTLKSCIPSVKMSSTRLIIHCSLRGEKHARRITPVEKEFGPDFIRAGINLDSVLGGKVNYNLRLAYHRTWLNRYGGEWLSGVQIGNTPKLFSEFYQPLDLNRRFFLEPAIAFQREPVGIYQNNNISELHGRRIQGGNLMAGINFGSIGAARLGWVGRDREASLETGTLAIESGGKRFGGWMARIDFEQLDRLYMPTHGWSVKGSYFDAPGENYSKAELDLRLSRLFAIFHGRLHFAGSPKGTLPPFDPVALGHFELVGIRHPAGDR